MAQFEKHFVQELTQDIKIRRCGNLAFNKDNLSNVISVELYKNGEPYSGGGTVAGACIRPDGETVPITNGTLTGNTASITLTGDCFTIPGQIGVGIQVVNGTIKTTVLKAIYNVELYETNVTADPGGRLTASIGQLVEDIEAATATIPASDMASLMAGIAPTFSTSTAYPAGAYVYNSGTLYRFTTAHAAGSWTGTDAVAVALGNDVSDLRIETKSQGSLIDRVFNKEQILNATRIAGNGNTAVTNNNDGSYTIGTTDYGNTLFGSPMSLEPGDYELFGVPNGIAFITPSTSTTSQSYNNRIVENTGTAPKIWHVDTSQTVYVGFRSPAKPGTSYTIYPTLYKYDTDTPTINSLNNSLETLSSKALQEKNIIPTNTDINTVTDDGIYLINSLNSYTHAPDFLTDSVLLVLNISNTVAQIAYQLGTNTRTYTPNIGFRFGYKTSGVTSEWKYIGRMFGQRFAMIGDSLTWGRNGNVSTSTDPGYRVTYKLNDIISHNLGIAIDNYGVSGMGWLKDGDGNVIAYDILSSLTLSDYDGFIFELGNNDNFSPLGEWDSVDETTVMGQFNKCIQYIMNNRPSVRVIVIAPFNGRNVGVFPDYWYGPRENLSGYPSRRVMSDTFKRACEYYWIPYIEQYDGPINPYSIQTLIGADGTHPTVAGYNAIGNWLSGKIGSLL